MMQTRFTRLVGCDLPIQMAGMGGVAIPPLVVAVCRAGGLGMLAGTGSSPQAMQRLLDDLAVPGLRCGHVPREVPRR
jgi:NAD(P)H-dependent flavin oxidoreductase YrpB (nitropropane dioxygenase family)